VDAADGVLGPMLLVGMAIVNAALPGIAPPERPGLHHRL
jgi:hypothetical protein